MFFCVQTHSHMRPVRHVAVLRFCKRMIVVSFTASEHVACPVCSVSARATTETAQSMQKLYAINLLPSARFGFHLLTAGLLCNSKTDRHFSFQTLTVDAKKFVHWRLQLAFDFTAKHTVIEKDDFCPKECNTPSAESYGPSLPVLKRERSCSRQA